MTTQPSLSTHRAMPTLKLSVFPEEPALSIPAHPSHSDLQLLKSQLLSLSKSTEARMSELRYNHASVLDWIKRHPGSTANSDQTRSTVTLSNYVCQGRSPTKQKKNHQTIKPCQV